MKILICTGIFPPDIGGPAQYAKNLREEFIREKHQVKVMSYKFEKKLPSGLRHCFYFLKIIPLVLRTNLIIALDTFSVGLPVVCAVKIFRRKIIFRIGGDFLWESYVERSGNLMPLKKFYETAPILSVKEKIIFSLTKFVLRNSTALVFSTSWQKEIFEKNYNLNPKKSFIIENFYGKKIANLGFKEKKFLWAGRPLRLKNLENLKQVFAEAKKENGDIKLEIVSGVSQDELMQKIQNCYAVILPSISDVSPNLILEGIMANKPFILTKETGLYGKLKDIGIFIDPLDGEDIKKKVLFLADDNNYKEYKERVANFNFTHSWKQIAGEFLEIYKKL